MGQFHYCDMPKEILDVFEFETVVKDKNDCINYGGIWKNRQLNFDNLGNSLTSLFIICTTEGWLDLMH